MVPTIYDIRTNADAQRFGLSTTQAGRWDLNRSERDYLVTRRIAGRGEAMRRSTRTTPRSARRRGRRASCPTFSS